LNDGKNVVIIDDLSTGNLENLRAVGKNPRLRVVQSKISQCPGLPELAAKAEFIFHLAATVGVELVVKSALHVLEASFHETQILLQAAARNRAPLLSLSRGCSTPSARAKPDVTEWFCRASLPQQRKTNH